MLKAIESTVGDARTTSPRCAPQDRPREPTRRLAELRRLIVVAARALPVGRASWLRKPGGDGWR